MKKLNEILGKQFLFLDGGTGSVLQAQGLKPGELPERWNLEHADKIVALHYNYYASGSNIVCTNTFGAYEGKFSDDELKAIIPAAIKNANKAKKDFLKTLSPEEAEEHPCFVAYDVGPCGKLLKPMGDLDFEDAVSLFKKSISIALENKGVDAVIIETMNDAYETKAAVIAAKEAMEDSGKKLPVLVTNVYDKSSRLLTGATPEVMVSILEGLGVSALGLNCGLGPADLTDAVSRLIKNTSVPVIIKPNAGLPEVVGGKTVYNVGPNAFTSQMKKFAKEGALIFGGCCGTTPAHIAKLSSEIKKMDPVEVTEKNDTTISSYTKRVQIKIGTKPVIIGERINPTGKKKFKEALRNNDIPYIIQQGLEQISAGSHVLDVNVGLPEIDEKEMMVRVMGELQSVTDIPLQIDTSSPDVMEAALRRYNGKALVNSVNGKREVMDAVFPLVKKYGGVVVALTLDESGIPETSAGRMKIVNKILKRAEYYGISKKNILIDALTMSVSSDTNAALATLETVKQVTSMGVGTVLGVSNISFGLPNREFVTGAFFILAMENGLTSAIINPLALEIKKAYHSFCLLKGYDKDCLEYIDFAQKVTVAAPVTGTAAGSGAPAGAGAGAGGSVAGSGANAESVHPLSNAVIRGLKDEAAKITTELLQKEEAVKIINDYLIPGLDVVGKGFEKKTVFLPQLLMSAEAAKSAFEVIKEYLSKTGKKGEPKGKVVIATVHGDIHDIGKNIVKVLLENYDFEVIDLGKDVPAEKVLEAVLKDDVKLVGLSALMTTTVPAMKETIELLHKKAPGCKTVVGGAVLTQEYADMIGADKYAKDALDTVHYAQEVFGVK
ncbi:MAG: homocysteine S-methyltransferase family protein [Treponema sp.]|nr:homocysteine S-methyltransferase family protein [Treponema sp.]